MNLTLNCIDIPDPERHYQPEFEMIEGVTYQGKRVFVDNRQYKNCRFVNCTFVYSGGPFGFLNCELEGDFLLSMTGAARRVRELADKFRDYQKTRPKLPY